MVQIRLGLVDPIKHSTMCNTKIIDTDNYDLELKKEHNKATLTVLKLRIIHSRNIRINPPKF